MTPARIADLLEPFLTSALSDTQLAQISIYIDLLLRWNARINLTAIRTPESIVTRHFGESLFAAQALFPHAATSAATRVHPRVGTGALTRPAEQSSAEIRAPHATRSPETSRSTDLIDGETGAPARPDQTPAATPVSAAPEPNLDSNISPSNPRTSYPSGQPRSAPPLDLLDIGSGAGFPGLPIKLWAPHLRATLLESQNKKVAFLREVIRSLTLTGIDVLPARAETVSTKSSVVSLRAVENFESILPIAARLVAPQGRLALLVGESQIVLAHRLCPTFSWQPPQPIPQASSRVLLIAVAS